MSSEKQLGVLGVLAVQHEVLEDVGHACAYPSHTGCFDRWFTPQGAKQGVGLRPLGAVVLLMLIMIGCAHQRQRVEVVSPAAAGERERGEASWYGDPYHGRRTASGEIYDMYELTAAHKTLPFGTLVRVERRDTGAEVTVRVNDRGPFVRGRIIDLSWAAAKAVGLDVDGVAPVTVTVLGMAPVAVRDPAPEVESAECVWVQVGAFSARDNAERVRERLVSSGETVVVMDGPQGLHRVRVGPFSRREDADAALRRLSADWPASQVVDCGG